MTAMPCVTILLEVLNVPVMKATLAMGLAVWVRFNNIRRIVLTKEQMLSSHTVVLLHNSHSGMFPPVFLHSINMNHLKSGGVLL